MRWLAVLALALATSAYGGTITFADVCAGYTVSKRGDDVLVRCPGMGYETPWLTVKNCRNPVVDRSVPGRLKISCA